jgi:RNA 3'-terminal phosphate cyclase-like protein
VYVHTYHGNAPDGGAGFGVHLVAESTVGCLLGAEWAAVDKDARPAVVAGHAVNMLLEQVAQGGCVDAQNSCLALLMCALADSDISRVRLGRLSDAAVVFLRDLKTFFGVVFKIRVDEQKVRAGGGRDGERSEGSDSCEEEAEQGEPVSRGIIMSCVGIGLVNTARQRF